mgnify:CR=1 FL=1
MAKIITKTLKYYDWNDVTKEVEDNCNRRVRDWAGRFGKNMMKPGAPYQDFWHKILDYDPEISSGCVIYFDFDEIANVYKNDSWVREVCDEYIKVVGTGEHPFKIEW